ncbi:Cytochrome P450 [Glarea lozoyensis ATCC 20868]|uniref:Cytochrome P450 n=1 Tax=Glarea lozoyensis (strain ATCC 20868 / MF5171) TaxID=1116229 RepID=S3DSJ4_GLAL2|nr:Cytochrome P450 [Glarea lozoyensis ATCC 20868]EPE34936.1 Cytochrome P450 [Glarea lozoyensis ATCC 20868]
MAVTSPRNFAVLGLLLGITTHWGYFIRGEHHMAGPGILAASFAGPLIILNVLLHFANVSSYHEAGVLTAIVTGAYVSGLISSIVTYRLLFHRLGKFPGPFYLRITKWNHTWLLIFKGARNYQIVDEWHAKYGSIVRTGPNELSITNPEAVAHILGSTSRCKKTGWYDCINKPNKSLNLERDRVVHDARRKIWDRGFSTKALRGYEGRVRKYTDQLVSQLNANAGKPINACKWFNYFAFDIMGDMAFGQSFGMVESGKEHSLISIMNKAMAALGPLTPIIWILPILKAIPGMAKPTWAFINYNQDQVAKRKMYEPESPDLFSYFIDAEKNDKNPMHRDLRWLVGDVGVIIVAGSDTTTSTLAYIFYHLAQSPHILRKLRDELDAFYKPGSESEFKDLQEAVYLNGVINESLRLHPPTPSGLQRLTPSEGMMIGSTFIPGRVTVSTPFWTLGRLEACYKHAKEFIPERWGSEAHMVIDKSVFLPFSTGPYGCVGKQLALMELRSVTARIVSEFDVNFAPGEDGSDLLEKSKDIFTLALAPLKLIFTRREG